MSAVGARGRACVLLATLLLLALAIRATGHAGPGRVSDLGRYEGYSREAYDGARRTSDYLALSNGTRLAYDLILPARRGVPAEGRLPVLFKYTPYLRTWTIFDAEGRNRVAELGRLGLKERAWLRVRYWLAADGHLMDPLMRTPWLRRLVHHGYAVIVVERPGTGASFGVMDATMATGGREAGEIVDWIAAQPWCDGNVGMFGDSFQAMVQFAAAATGNPHLKAIFPVSSPLDMYGAVTYPGGVRGKAFDAFFQEAAALLEQLATPVDRDRDGALLAAARRERSATLAGRTMDIARRHPFRDAVLADGSRLYEDRGSLYPLLDRINRARVPVSMTSGWFDLFTADMFLWYANLTAPRRLVVRPVDHSGVEDDLDDLDVGAEAHRWFDRWLKGVDNGITDGPSVHYYVMGAPPEAAWRGSRAWPPAEATVARLYLGAGRTGSADSGNDGALGPAPPVAAAADVYTVDYTTTTGPRARWSSVNWPRRYPDMRANDRKALTYTTAPLGDDVVVTGHPVARLWLSTEAPDVDVFVYLEDVAPGGASTYVTEGVLRASHRALAAPPYDTLGLPYHSHRRADVAALPPGAPVELALALQPTAYRFRAGHRLRVVVAGADADNFDTPVLVPAPRLKVLREPAHASRVEVPVVGALPGAPGEPRRVAR
jgi:putative CocE/NonD family hydrolase